MSTARSISVKQFIKTYNKISNIDSKIKYINRSATSHSNINRNRSVSKHRLFKSNNKIQSYQQIINENMAHLVRADYQDKKLLGKQLNINNAKIKNISIQ